ncbi:MAG: ribosome biogenesis GTPase Der [Patescibacteria group bacterium]|jgi:GTP-binding protein
MAHSTIPTIAIIGRTNVGKSTLFNRLTQEQKSLVSSQPGTTRDRFEGPVIWRGSVVRFVDTGGIGHAPKDEMEKQMFTQARAAMHEADVIAFVVDAQTGVQEEDRRIAEEIVQTKKPVVFIANKADNPMIRDSLSQPEWHRFPFGTPLAICAHHNTGLGDLLDEVYKALELLGIKPGDIQDVITTRVAVIGRPNVGKSTLLNSLLGEKRFITSPLAHTTREPNDTDIEVNDKRYTLVDTAGIRRSNRVARKKVELEKVGVERTLEAIKTAHVVLFVLDSSEEVNAQDKHLAGVLEESGVSVVIIANKWDMVPEKDTETINRFDEYYRAHFPMLSFAPIVFTSATTGQRVLQLFEVIDEVFKTRFTRLTKAECKEFMSRAIMKHKPSRGRGVQHPDILSFEQTGVNPPDFTLHIRQSRADALNPSYLHFLTNLLRDQYEFSGTPIRIRVAARKKHHTT